MPNPGVAAITAVAGPEARLAAARWIWGAEVRDGQTLFFNRSFTAPAGLRAATLFITCDDAYRVWLNGSLIGQGGDFHRVARIGGLERRIRPGRNQIAVEARNGTGPAGLLAWLEMATRSGRRAIATDRSWRYFSAAPAGWPSALPGAGNGAMAREEDAVGEGVWGRSLLFAGQPQGQGYGPRHDQYVDCYSAELSNDIEPTSRSAPGYRSRGGWGFAAYRQMRALIARYRRECR